MAREQVKKAYIQNNATNDIMEFQFNPPEFNDKLGVEFSELSSPGMSAPMFQYIGGKARVVTFELYLNAWTGYRGQVPIGPSPEGVVSDLYVKAPIRFLHSFLPPADAGKTFSPPPTMTFAWGWFVKTCILTDLDINYTRFNAQLDPIEAKVNLTLTILE
jgi:hypothetical protein